MLNCKICERKFQDYTSLGSHIGQSHRDTNIKEYYDKYLKKDPLEGICKKCRKETKFVGLTRGYSICCSRKCSTTSKDYEKIKQKNRKKQICKFCKKEFISKVALSAHLNHRNSIHKNEIIKIKEKNESNKKIICKICGNKYKDYRSLGVHLNQKHGNYNRDFVKNYYDKHIKKNPKEGNCKTCGKQTRFMNLVSGYNDHCNTSCSKLNPEIEIKIKNTCLEKFGVTNFAKTNEWKNQMLNGQAFDMISKNTSPSKPQKKLFNLVKKIYPNTKIEYWIDDIKRKLDIAIIDKKICIEYDGWYWHQEHNKEYDIKRQKDIESLGWKVLRYNGGIRDTIPSKEQIIKDIKNILK